MVAIGILGLMGAVLALIGAAFGASSLIGVGVFLFFVGFFVSGLALSSIPSVVWIFLIILLILWLSKKK